MQILETKDVDIIEPFPRTEVKRVYNWMHCYKSIVQTDESPKTLEEFEAWMNEFLSSNRTRSFGVIDRGNKLGIRHEAPLIGIALFEYVTPHNGYFHVASTRRAWGTYDGPRFIDQAGAKVIEHLFLTDPALTRVSAYLLDKNHPAKNLAKRLGFVMDGIFRDMVVQNNEPQTIVHFGLTRKDWICRFSSPRYLLEAVLPPAPMEAAVNKVE